MRRLGILANVVLLLPTMASAGDPGRGGATDATSRKAELMAARREADRLRKLGRYTEAARAYERAVALAPAVHGSDDPKTATLLNNLASLYESMGKYPKAEPLYLRSLKILEAKLPKNDLRVAVTIHELAGLYVSDCRYSKAEPLYLRSLEILMAKLDKDHPNIAGSRNNLASLYEFTARYDKAKDQYEQSLAILKKHYPTGHPSVARVLNNLARVSGLMGQYPEAEQLFLRSLRMSEKLGVHLDSATTLHYYANVQNSMGQYTNAERSYLRSLDIREKKLGKNHLAVADSLNRLGGLYVSTGQYIKAEPRLVRGFNIRRAQLGEDHPDVARSLHGLANLYDSLAQYAKAELLYLRSLKINEARLGKNHPNVARGLVSLAGLYFNMAQYTKAEPIYLRNLKILEDRLGKNHPDVGKTLHNLSVLYLSMEKYAEAQRLLGRCLKIRVVNLGKNHPAVAQTLISLAYLRGLMGDYAKAEALYLAGLTILDAPVAKDHLTMASALNNMGSLYVRMDQHHKAELACLRGLKIREAKLGKDHPSVGATLNNLAALYAFMGQYAKAWSPAERAAGILVQARSVAGRSALVKSSFFGQRSPGDFYPSLALKLQKNVDVLNLLERQRSLGLRELLAESKARLTTSLSEGDQRRVETALARINFLNTAIEKHASRPKVVESLRQELAAAERNYDTLMAKLKAENEQLVAVQTVQAITSEQIVKSSVLDENTAVVGWVEFQDWLWGYVIRGNGVKWVDMTQGFDPAEHKKLVTRLRQASQTIADSAPLAKDALRLNRTHFAPLAKHLEGVQELIVINQGWAATLPVEMVLTNKPPANADLADWPWLARKYEISYAPSVTTLEILVRQRGKRKSRKWPQPLLALADPPFSDEQLALMKSEKKSPLGQLLALADPAKRNDSMLTRLLRFDAHAIPRRLPGTRREARMIAGLLGPQQSLLLFGPDASERKLFEASKSGKLKQCRYIHLATHGFADSDRPEFSGLALARVPSDEDYDGILHMREVFQLKLDAELVVLSACQTGLGKNLGGEGVVGLSTAFFFAGTPSLVMSLWNVPDTPTALLMHRFYSNLKAGKTKAAALREAKAWLRNLTRDDLKKLGRADPVIGQLTRGLGKAIESEKGRLLSPKPFAHPHYWACFILTGDPQ